MQLLAGSQDKVKQVGKVFLLRSLCSLQHVECAAQNKC